MELTTLESKYAVCRLEPTTPIPDWATQCEFYTISKTADELSILCPEDQAPEGIPIEKGWKAFKIEGPLPFGLTGIMDALIHPLAKAKVPIFAFSTFDTDYILVQQEHFSKAREILSCEGHQIN